VPRLRFHGQAAIKALGKHQITSKLVWDCHQSLIQLARHNRVQLIWVPGHEGTVGNETAEHLARTGYEHPFIGQITKTVLTLTCSFQSVS
jgi:ribonuclease HI